MIGLAYSTKSSMRTGHAPGCVRVIMHIDCVHAFMRTYMYVYVCVSVYVCECERESLHNEFWSAILEKCTETGQWGPPVMFGSVIIHVHQSL